ncbi:hypothetical protein CXB51_034318 [Gossypium anomalum]|uniref:Uncharacterized protein n=3 Tax=Gossypium TaxID=3633 RepID=A0A8J5Y1J6_9ROSI|nr:hypothetical protein CXB51_034318 [Gossypium anomalum]
MGNILFISGVTLTIGLKSTMQFFMKPQNFKGTISFGVGFFFVVVGWPIFGMILETYGFVWFLANTGSVSAEDTNSWLAIPATIRQIGMFSFEVNYWIGIGAGGCLYNHAIYQRAENSDGPIDSVSHVEFNGGSYEQIGTSQSDGMNELLSSKGNPDAKSSKLILI